MTLSRELYDDAKKILDEVAETEGRGAVERLEQTLAGGAGLAPPPADARDPLQRPPLWVPGLTAKPWHDPLDYPFTEAVSRRWREIHGELEAILASRSGFQPFNQSRDEFVPEGFWDAFYFRIGNEWFEENRDLCPATFEVLESVPRLAEIAMFSQLRPGGHIEPHCGTWNCRITCHLGLTVPDDCALRVGTESRGWRPGEWLVFDDSFEHEAWNRSQKPRVVLLFDIWHPDLTDIEVRLLERLRAEAGLHDGSGMVQQVRKERQALRTPEVDA